MGAGVCLADVVTDLAFFQDAGLYDPGADDAHEVRDLLYRLEDLGWSPEEVVGALENCDLAELAASASLRSMPELSIAEAAAQLEMDVDEFDELRRTAGLAPRPIDGPAFTKADISAFLSLQQGKEMFTTEEANHFARVLGSSMARIADAAVSLFLIDVEGPLRDAGGTDFDLVRQNFMAAAALDGVAAALDPLLRMHLEDAIHRSRESRLPGEDVIISRMAVGFVDLVGFTAFSETSSAAEIGTLVRVFEDTAYDLVAENGGRVVKLIGDEVMFVAVDGEVACRTAMALIERFRGDRVTPRAGLAYGELLARGGDYYGPIVNLASRLGDLAVRGEILATPELADLCPSLEFEPAGRRQLKGFAEPVALVSISS